MARRDDNLQARLDRDLAELKLTEIARSYREVLDDAARKGSSMLEVLATLFGMELAACQQRALERRLRLARLPKPKTLAEYDFNFPKRVPKAAILRLFDCEFIPEHGCAVLIGPTGTGKSHLLTALGYRAAERGYTVLHTRVVDMINHLTMAQIKGRLGTALRTYIRPSLLLLDELGYLPIDKRGADLLFQVVAARYEIGSIVLSHESTVPGMGHPVRYGQHPGHGLDRPADASRGGDRHSRRELSDERQRSRFAQRVTKHGASTSRVGVPVEVSRIRRVWQGCPAHP